MAAGHAAPVDAQQSPVEDRERCAAGDVDGLRRRGWYRRE